MLKLPKTCKSSNIVRIAVNTSSSFKLNASKSQFWTLASIAWSLSTILYNNNCYFKIHEKKIFFKKKYFGKEDKLISTNGEQNWFINWITLLKKKKFFLIKLIQQILINQKNK